MKRIIFVLILLPLLSSHAMAWMSAAHYSMGRALGYDDNDGVAGNMNLPDVWPNRHGLPGRAADTMITDVFTWSHATQRTGLVGVSETVDLIITDIEYGIGIPKRPRIMDGGTDEIHGPDDGRWPGRIMYQIASDKTNWDEWKITWAERTAIGFVGHNAMDNVVHFDYFLAGPGSQRKWNLIDWPWNWKVPLPWQNWAVDHAKKEEWADYLIWMREDGKNAFYRDEDINGKAKTFFGKPVQYVERLIPMNCNYYVVQIAQKVARKLRRKMDYEKNSGKESNDYSTVETIAEIRDKVRAFEVKMTEEIRARNKEEYRKLLRCAAECGWDKDDMFKKYDASVKNAKEWIAAYCN